MLIFKFLHIAAMFGAVTLVVGSSVFLDMIGRTRDVATYRRLDAVTQRTDIVAFGLFLVGLVFGFLTAVTGGFDLLASWLVLAYVVVAGLFIEGFVLTIPSYNRLREAANLADDEAATEEVGRLLHSPRHLVALASMVTLWLAAIFVMVIKPDLF
jgi:hypothetical protein